MSPTLGLEAAESLDSEGLNDLQYHSDSEGTARAEPGQAIDADDTIASLSFHSPRCIRLLCFPDSIIDIVRETINAHWGQGLQEERDQARALEFQMKGYPWYDNINGPRLVCRLLEALHRQGWARLITTASSMHVMNLDQMFFEYCGSSLAAQGWMSIVFDDTSKVYFLDAPGDILAVMVASIGSEKKTHGPTKLSGCYEFQLKGKPWRGMPQDHTAASLRMMTILQTLKRNGWHVYANFGSRIIQRDKFCVRRPDAWICCRPADWDPSTSPDFQ